MIHHADPDADAEALERLAVWALRYSPLVAADDPDGLVIDATGASHLHGGEDAMLADMVARLAAVGIAARAAIADTQRRGACPGALCGPAGPGRSGAGRARSGSSRCRSRRCGCRPTLVDDLRKLGFERIGELLATPRAPLALRFGPELGRRWTRPTAARANRSSPSGPRTSSRPSRFSPNRSARPRPSRATSPSSPSCSAGSWNCAGLGARRLDLLFGRVDNRVEAIRVGTAQPVRDVKRLTRLLCDKIEKVDPGFGIEIMRLAATAAEPFATRQMISSLVEEPEAGCFRPDRHAVQPGRREPGSIGSRRWQATFRNAQSSGSPQRLPPPGTDGRLIGPAQPGS